MQYIYIYIIGEHPSHVFGGFLCSQSLTEPGSARGYNHYYNGYYMYTLDVSQYVLLHVIIIHLFSINHTLVIIHGSLNVPIEHHPTIRYMVYNGYYKVCPIFPKWDIYQPLLYLNQLYLSHLNMTSAASSASSSDPRGTWTGRRALAMDRRMSKGKPRKFQSKPTNFKTCMDTGGYCEIFENSTKESPHPIFG